MRAGFDWDTAHLCSHPCISITNIIYTIYKRNDIQHFCTFWCCQGCKIATNPDGLEFYNVDVLSQPFHPREYWLMYGWPGFLAVVWFGHSPLPSHPIWPLSKLDRRHTQEDREREITCRLVTGEGGGIGGGGGGLNQTRARKPGPL